MSLPHVVLVGDSIRLDYQDAVRQQLAGIAHVDGPPDNGGDSRHLLAHLPRWLAAHGADLVVVNCGLHDIKRARDAGGTAVPLDEYEANVIRILAIIREQARALPVWATTTPVIDAWHAAHKAFDRRDTDVIAYNAAALRAAQAQGAAICDLNAVVTRGGPASLLRPDGVHFLPAGSALLGAAVAACVTARLSASPTAACRS